MKYKFPPSASENLKIELKITAPKVSPPTGTLEVKPTLQKYGSGLEVDLEKSEVLVSKSISPVCREILEPQLKLNLLEQTTISPFIQNFDNSYRELYWLGDYLQSIISYTSLNTRKLLLKLIFSSQEILISQNEMPIITDKVSTASTTHAQNSFDRVYVLHKVK